MTVAMVSSFPTKMLQMRSMKGQYFFVTLRILRRSISDNNANPSNNVNGAQILSRSNDHKLEGLANEVDEVVARSLKSEKEM